MLDSVTFASGNNPSHGNHNLTRTVTWTVNDGGGSNNLATATTTIAISHGNGNSNDNNGNNNSASMFNSGANSGVVWQNDTPSIGALTLPTPWGNIGSGNFNGDLLWTGSNAGPPVAGGAVHLSAPDGVSGTGLAGVGIQGIATFALAANDPLSAAGGNAMAGLTQLKNEHPTFGSA